jgi:Mrp family chromosome partitioning ATPase/uncharacterized protein involved in exopolysaccharide biosynthesis
MSEQMQLLPAPANQNPPQQLVHMQAAAPPPGNPLAALHNALRGRYWWVVPIALMLAAVGVGVGYRVMPPKYEGVGLIRIRPYTPKVLYTNDQNSVMPMFDSFMESQVAFIQGRRVIDQAMQHPDWKALGRGTSPDAVSEFIKSVEITHPRNAEIIRVTFTDSDPNVATVGARAVVEAYERLYVEDDVDGAKRMSWLETHKVDLGARLKSITDRIQTIGKPYGSDKLDPILDYKLQEQNKAESELKSVQLALAQAQGRQPASATTQPAELSAEAIAAADPRAQEALKYKLDAQRNLKVLLVRHGENHPDVLTAQAMLSVAESQLQGAIADFRMANPAGMTRTGSRIQDLALPSVEQLRAQEANIKGFYDKLKADTVALGEARFEIEKLRLEAEDMRQKLTETNNRIEQLNQEGVVSGRLDIMSRGDLPDHPTTDRRIALAAACGFGGIGLTIGVFLTIGLVDRRFRYVADAKAAGLRKSCQILGVIPRLSASLGDSEEVGTAAHCVHQIRSLLQIRSRATGQRVFAVTSPSPGDGKTSLTVALGLSAAASGCRTLLIDCDISGGGLTARIGQMSRSSVGDLLFRAGLITEAQLAEAWQRVLRSGGALSDALVATGAVTPIDIARTLASANGSCAGLLDAIAGASWARCIVETAAPGLCVLPVGNINAAQNVQLSPESIHGVLEQVRGVFDVVFIDTGPVLGSAETSVVAAEADSVVLMVSRGEQRPSAEKAIEHLHAIGADLAGIVFNRARPTDLEASGYSSRVSGRSSPSVRATGVDSDKRARYAAAGPMAGAVASATWTAGETSEQNN